MEASLNNNTEKREREMRENSQMRLYKKREVKETWIKERVYESKEIWKMMRGVRQISFVRAVLLLRLRLLPYNWIRRVDSFLQWSFSNSHFLPPSLFTLILFYFPFTKLYLFFWFIALQLLTYSIHDFCWIFLKIYQKV